MKEFARFNAKSLGELGNHHNGCVVDAALQRADISTVSAGLEGQCLLRKTPCVSRLPQIASDARGLAQLVRSGWFRSVHVKSEQSHRLKLLLTSRRLLKRKLVDIENEMRQSLKSFGLLLGPRVQRSSFDQRVRDLVAHDPLISRVMASLLTVWSALWTEYKQLHKLIVQIVARDELCRRFMGIPGVGPIVALTFRTGVDDPHLFRKSKTFESGDTIAYDGRISKCGDPEVRAALYEAASAMLVRSRSWRAVKGWGVKIAARRGHRRVVTAVARKLAVIMRRMWLDGTEFRFAAGAPTDGTRPSRKRAALAAA